VVFYVPEPFVLNFGVGILYGTELRKSILMISNPSIYYAFFVGFSATFALSVLLVLTKHFHGKFTLDSSEGVQKFHSLPTPRIGGIALAFGYFAAWFAMESAAKDLFGIIGLAGLPALAIGLAEDITKKVSVRVRLIATMASGMIFAIVSGYTITSVEVWGLDAMLAIPVISLAFTTFAIAGAANSINLIDGFHGLASGTLVIILLAFALVGWRIGDDIFVILALTMSAIIFGFFLVNFPFGKLFLGDAGAYFAGYFVAIMAVMLPARNPEVSPWVSLLILGYPVTETIVSIVRRVLAHGAHPGEPDSNHLHHIVHRSWAKSVASTLRIPTSQNSITSVLMWVLPLITLISVNYCGFHSMSALTYLAAVVFFYLTTYRVIIAWEASRAVAGDV
jgi:UDP-N-acetylmuramyl pentapeptide phosphotransferase/UDP-N-acetylglucosamine-1-phosphate transferase